MTEEHLLPASYPFLAIYAICSTIGITSNFAIVLATFRNAHLRSSCNYLIALASICDALTLTGHLPIYIDLWKGQLRISSQTCILREAPSVIGQNGSAIMVLSIGIDRLVACIFPIYYTNKIISKYLFTHCFALALYMSLVFYIVFANFEERQIVCMLPSPYMDEAKIQWLSLNFAVCGTAIVVYIVVAVKLRTARYLATFGIATIYRWIEPNPDLPMLILADYIIGLPVNLSTTITYWVYYATSSDYRQAFRAQLHYITGWRRFLPRAESTVIATSSIVKRF